MFQRRPAQPERPTLDADYLARLESHLTREALAELIADGLIELSDRLKRLGGLERSRDLEAMAQLGHDLVGMAGNLDVRRPAVVPMPSDAYSPVPTTSRPAAVLEIGMW